MTPTPSSIVYPARCPRAVLAFLVAVIAVAALLSGASRADAVDDETILSDTLDRTVEAGWGSDPGGDAYEPTASAISSVADGSATLTAPAAGRTAMVRWNARAVADVDVVTSASFGDVPEGSGVYFSTHVRDTGVDSYAARLRVLGDGGSALEIVSFTGYTARVLADTPVDLAGAAGSGFSIEISAVGTSPVDLRARVWAAGAERPDWQVMASDARLTAPGGIAWSSYASEGGTVVPVAVNEITATSATPSDAETPAPASCADGELVCDGFDRAVVKGWGAAQLGGDWSASSAAVLSVEDGAGLITSPVPGRASTATLPTSVPADARLTADIGIRALPSSGSGVYLSLATRVVGDSSYAVRLRVTPGGGAELQVVKLKKLISAEVLSSAYLTDPVHVGDIVHVAFQTGGSGEVALAAKAWMSTEPTAWTVATTDSSATRIPDAGRVAVALYSSSGGDAPAVAVESLAVRAASPDDIPSPAEPENPTEPQPPAPGGDDASSRGDAGAAAPGSFSYPAPATAIHVSRSGSDAGSGTPAQPFATITAALRKVPTGGTILVHEGVYHEEVIVPPQKRVTIQPAPGDEVWLDGAEAVTGWRADGGVWVKDGWTLALDSSPTYTKGAPDGATAGWQFVDPQYPMAAHPDQVWVGGSQLTEVASRAEVGPGTFFVDAGRSQLVIGSNPGGATVEASTLTQAMSIRSVGSVLQGIGVRRYATSVPQMGTVVVAAPDVTVADVTIRDNSTTGLYSWSARTTFERVSVTGNGLLGAGASTADGLRVDRLLSVGNNASQFNRAPVSGAFKVTRSRDIEVTDSAFLDNLGQGPWFDESVYDIVFTGNDVVGNTGNGLVFELSEKVVIADNIVSDNALNGIFVIDTGNVKVWNNTAVGNQRNLAVIQDKRRASDTSAPGHDPRQPNPDPTMPWITRNTEIVNNVIGDAGGNCLICVEDRSKEFTGAELVTRSDGNLYSRATPEAPRWFSVWSRGIGDPATSLTLSAFTAATGQDSHSQLVEGRSVVGEDYRILPDFSLTAIAQAVPAGIAAHSHLATGAKALGAQPR